MSHPDRPPATAGPTYEAYDLADANVACRGLGWTLDPARAALLVHDALPYYLRALPDATRVQLVGNCGRVVVACRAAGVPVISSAPRPATVPAQRGLAEPLWGIGPSAAEAEATAVPELAGYPHVRVWKRSLSAFFATDLDVELRRLARTQLLVAGVYAGQGILATAFDALARDIEFLVVGDAVGDRSNELHSVALDQIARSAGQVIDLATAERRLRA